VVKSMLQKVSPTMQHVKTRALGGLGCQSSKQLYIVD
jgi:hypothetical protein